MLLDPDGCELFFRLHKALMLFVNRRLKLVKPPPAPAGEITGFPPDERLKLRDALLKHTDLIDAFADENPFEFSDEDLEIVRSWKNLVSGTFYVFRYLKAHAVFLTDKEPVVAYGVLALFDPFEALIGSGLPRMVETTLLPFKGRIVYDGLFTGYNVTFGGGIKRRLNESYKEAKARYGVVTSLPVTDGTASGAVGTPKARVSGPKLEAKGGKAKTKAADGRAKPRAAREGRSPLVGRWRITWMEMWDQSFVDAEVEGFIRFDEDGSGEFQFGYVHGYVNYQETEHNDKPAVVFTFEGNDEMDPCSGRGWAFRKGDRIGGKIVFHGGDESKFKAETTSG